jgi:hypothetical protein
MLTDSPIYIVLRQCSKSFHTCSYGFNANSTTQHKLHALLKLQVTSTCFNDFCPVPYQRHIVYLHCIPCIPVLYTCRHDASSIMKAQMQSTCEAITVRRPSGPYFQGVEIGNLFLVLMISSQRGLMPHVGHAES